MKKILIVLSILLSTMMFYSCNENVNENLQVKNDEIIELSKDIGAPIDEIDDVAGNTKGFMWKVEKDDNIVYLFGSIHLADENMYPFRDDVENAFISSDYLVVEADPSDMSQIKEMTEKMMYSGSDSVYDYLSEEGIVKYELIVEELGYSPSMFEKIQIWALGSNLMVLQLDNADYAADSGVDMYFVNQAKATNKSILELEGAMFQVDLLSSFSSEIQEEMFISSLGTIDETITEFEVLYNNYLAGDVEYMTEYLMTEDISKYPEAEKAMLEDRNIGMVKKIETYLDTEDQYFVVVGLAHLLGNESIVKMLESKGYEVNLIE